MRNAVTLVCTGNTCRSPMAAALLAHALAAEPEPLSKLRVESAGVHATNGAPASENSVRAVAKVGLDLHKHRSRLLTEALIERSVLMLAMTTSHLQAIRMNFGEHEHIHLMRDFLPEGVDREIPDPIGGPLEAYELTRDAMVEAIPSILAHLREKLA